MHAAKLLQSSCLTLCDPLNCSPLGSSVHGILQARTLEWVAVSFSRGSSQSRDQTCIYYKISLVAQTVKRLLTMQETRVQSLGWEDPLEKEMATHSSILPHGRRSLVAYSPWGHKGSNTTERLYFHFHFHWQAGPLPLAPPGKLPLDCITFYLSIDEHVSCF